MSTINNYVYDCMSVIDGKQLPVKRPFLPNQETTQHAT